MIPLLRAALYIDSPPRRSPGKYEFRELGVARCWSLLSIPALLQRELLLGGAPHNWLELPPQVSGGGPVLFDGRKPQPAPVVAPACCWPPWLSCCNKLCTSVSAGDSAKIVVLPRTQLFKAPCAWNYHQILSLFILFFLIFLIIFNHFTFLMKQKIFLLLFVYIHETIIN